MADRWFYAHDGDRIGPFSDQQLRDQADAVRPRMGRPRAAVQIGERGDAPAATDAADEENVRLDDVDVTSFLRLSGDHYYTYPTLVRERAAAIRTGKLTVEGT